MEAKMDGTLLIDVTVAERVRAIVAQHVQRNIQDISLNDRMSDLGLDSLGLVELIFALEEAFDVSVPFNANEGGTGGPDLSTVGAVVSAVEGLIAAR